jgi:hypothetical protein
MRLELHGRYHSADPQLSRFGNIAEKTREQWNKKHSRVNPFESIPRVEAGRD